MQQQMIARRTVMEPTTPTIIGTGEGVEKSLKKLLPLKGRKRTKKNRH